MSEQALRKHLEFYRDLGFEELFLGSSETEPERTPENPDTDAATSAEVSVERAPVSDESPAPVAPASDAGSEQQLSPLQVIQEDIGDCTRCHLHKGRKTIVFGSGNPNAKLVFIGEGPGADEDAQGLPFVGRAGQLLTRMIDGTCERIGLQVRRPDVYICNVVKCRPPDNRAPELDEMAICGQFLFRQVKAIQPKAICVLGGTAAKALLRPGVGITKLRGNWTEWGGIRVMPTYHPSYLLRGYNPEGKRQAFEDLKEVFTYVYK
ncbi:MAG: uracil-DNA glycosylase [Bryobacterales bacterium]|nr:uracil-DNA glycosylase [Bryobacterales bacterium]MDE0623966.1 uracil-DNA glycosylase [Bryobacterales bacterium]